jgi:branched-chain amino acid transport system permease protein
MARCGEPARVLGTLVLAALVVLWIGGDLFREDLAMQAVMYALLALGMYLPFNLGGALSLAYPAYVAIGGYAVGLVATETSWSLLMGYLLGAVVAALVALLLGLASRRLSGFYLAAVTVLFVFAFNAFLLHQENLTHGALGIGGIRSFGLFGHEVPRQAFVAASVFVVWLVAVAVDRIRRSPFGVAVQSTRDAAPAVEAVGIRVPTVKLVVLTAGAGIASLGGGLFVSANGAVGPDTFSLNLVLVAIFMPLLGGERTAWGAVLGAGIVVELVSNVPVFQSAGSLIFGLAAIVVLLAAPKGLLGYGGQLAAGLGRLVARRRGTTKEGS